jgi:hypothetical protein
VTWPGVSDDLRDALYTAHSIRTRIEVLDLAMRPTGQQVTNTLLDGQVNVDADADITRSMTATFHDPDRQLVFDPDSPADGALYADRMLRAWYGVRAPLGNWIEVPIFTGPVVAFSRDGGTVEVECQGKEYLALGATWETDHYGNNEKKVDVIETALRREGERHFGFERFGALVGGASFLVGSSITVPAEQAPWEFCQRQARSMGAHLFYDGYGTCRLRHPPKKALWTFRTGEGGSILTPPRITYDSANLKNAVAVVGRRPTKKRKGAGARVVAPKQHPFSPLREGRERRLPYLAEFIDDTTIGTDREARIVANELLDQRLMQHVSVESDVIVTPHLEEGDPVTYRTDDFELKVRLAQFTIPLTAAGTMSVGYHKKTTRPKRRRR